MPRTRRTTHVDAQEERSKIPTDDFSGDSAAKEASAEDEGDKIQKHVNPKVEDAAAQEVPAAEASAKDGERTTAEEAGATTDAVTAALYGDLGLFKSS